MSEEQVMDGINLPPLPDPMQYLYVWNTQFGRHVSTSCSPYNGRQCDQALAVHTADQMTAYARAAVLVDREQRGRPAACVHQVQTGLVNMVLTER